MSIVAAHCKSVRLPMVAPVHTAQQRVTSRETIILEVRSADGAQGHGEASFWPGFSSVENPHALQIQVEHACHLLDGMPTVENIEECRRVSKTLAAGAVSEGAVIFAVEAAWLDILGQHTGVALAQILSKTALESVVISGAAVARSHADAGQSSGSSNPEGVQSPADPQYSVIKLKIAQRDNAVEALAYIKMQLERMHPHQRLRLDANGGFSLVEAKTLIDALGKEGLQNRIEWLEEPTCTEHLGMAAWTSLRGRGIPIAADESLVRLSQSFGACSADFVSTLMAQADAFVLKPAFLGLFRAYDLGVALLTAGVPVATTCAWESNIGRTAALHVTAALGATQKVSRAHFRAAGLHTPIQPECDFGRSPAVVLTDKGARMRRPLEPGLGIHIEALLDLGHEMSNGGVAC